MKDDGDLEITSNAGSRLWSTNTAGNVEANAVMQAKGNLVVYKADGSTVLWDSKTSGAEGYAVLQDRGVRQLKAGAVVGSLYGADHSPIPRVRCP